MDYSEELLVQKNEQPKKKSDKKRFLLFALLGALSAGVIVLVLFLTGVFGLSKYEGSGYDTPEEAVEAYLEALKEGDTEAMLATFAIETAVDNVSFEDYYLYKRIEKYKHSWVALPTDTEFGYDIAVQRRAAAVTELVSRPFFMAADNAFDDLKKYYEDGGYSDSYNIGGSDEWQTFKSPEEREAFIEEYDNGDSADFYADMEINEIYINTLWQENYNAESDIGEITRENYEMTLKGLGADDYLEMVADVEIDGEEYCVYFAVVCYDDTWFLYQYGSYGKAATWIYEKEAS